MLYSYIMIGPYEPDEKVGPTNCGYLWVIANGNVTLYGHAGQI